MTTRISRLVSYIGPFQYIADIGCDHGHLINIAFKEKEILFAQAIDNKLGPLTAARKNLHHLDNVYYSLSDGLEELDDSVEVVVIAGMGGIAISNILNNNQKKLHNLKRLIIQPNRDQYLVRAVLMGLGWKIIAEEILIDYGKIYEIIIAEIGEMKLSESELTFGPYLMKEKNDIFIKKWNIILEKLYSHPLAENKNMINLIKSILR